MLGPGALTTHLADLGADVIKIEPPQGDYGRRMTWPIVEGVSLLFLHVSRGKRSVVLDLRTEAGKDAFRELVRGADAVVEGMRPGGLDRRGLGFEQLREVNPRIVFVTISGYGMTGPYRDMPSHGIAYDTWAGIVQPADERRRLRVPPGARVDRHPRRAAVRRARPARRDHCAHARRARAASSRSRSRTRPPRWTGCAAKRGRRTSARSRRSPATRPTTTSAARPAPRAWRKASATSSTRRRTDTSSSWRRSRSSGGTSAPASTGWTCSSGGRARSTPTTRVATLELRAILRDIFATRTSDEWLEFGLEHNTPIAPSNTPKTLLDDPQFQDRFPLIPAARLGADMLPTPLKFIGEELPVPTKAPTVGEHTEAVLRDALGLDRRADRSGAGERRVRDRVRLTRRRHGLDGRRVRGRAPAP